jgi:putative membrane protein
MMFMSIFWIIILVGGVYLLMKYLSTRRKGDVGQGWFGSNPLDILRERYARGEIEQAEFERIKHDFEGVG